MSDLTIDNQPGAHALATGFLWGEAAAWALALILLCAGGWQVVVDGTRGDYLDLVHRFNREP